MPVKLSHKLPVKDTNQFFGALNHQVMNGTFCDVLLVCDGGQRIVGHKAILAASSPYFYNLFTATEPSQEPIDTTANFDTMANSDTTANFDTTANLDTTANFDSSVSLRDESTNGVHKVVVKRVLSKKDPIKVFGIGGIKYRHVQAMVDCIYRKQIILDDPGEDFDTFIQLAQDTFGVLIDRTTFTIGSSFDTNGSKFDTNGNNFDTNGNNFDTSDPLQTGSSALQVVEQPLVTGSKKGRKRGMNQAIDLSTKVGATVAARPSSPGRFFLAKGLSSLGKSSAAGSVSAGKGKKLNGVRDGSSAAAVPTSAVAVPTSAAAVPTSAVAVPTSAATVPTSSSAGNDTTKHQSLEALRSLTTGHHGSMSGAAISPTVRMNHPFQSFVQQNWNPIYSQAMTNWTQGWNQNQIQGRYQSVFGQNRDQATFVGSEQGGTCDNGREESGKRHEESGKRNEESGKRNEESGKRHEESGKRNEESGKRHVAKDTRIKCIWEGCKKYFRSDNSMMAHLLSTHYQEILECPKTGCSKKSTKSGTFMNHVVSHGELIEPELLKSHLVMMIEECKRKAEEQLEALNGQKAGTENVASKVASEPVVKKRKKNSSGVDLSRRPSQTFIAISSSAKVASKSTLSANVASKSTLSGSKSVAPSGLKSPPPSFISPPENVTSKSSPSPPMVFLSPRMTFSPFKSVPSTSLISSEFGNKILPIRGTQIDRIEYIDSESDQTEEEEDKVTNGSKSECRNVTSSQG